MLRGSLLCLFSSDKLRLHAILRRPKFIAVFFVLRLRLTPSVGHDADQKEKRDADDDAGAGAHNANLSNNHVPPIPDDADGADTLRPHSDHEPLQSLRAAYHIGQAVVVNVANG